MRRFLLVQISDLHITGSEGNQALAALASAVKMQIDRLRMQTDCSVYLFITGDLVSSPTVESIGAASAFVHSLETTLGLSYPPLIVPGNHDIKTIGGSFGKKNESRFFEAFPESQGVWHKSFQKDGLEILGVDSNGDARFARGELKQVAYDGLLEASNRLAETIKSTAHNDLSEGSLRVLALHHHPLPIAEGENFKELGFIPDEGFMYLQSPATFLGAALSFGCQVILHGHRHVSGLARYSVPNIASYSRDVLMEEEAWSTVYVVSCPSSTGVHCDAGFNILEFDENDRQSWGSDELKLYRFTRPRNAGAFVSLDRRGHSNCIRLSLGKAARRDLAVTTFHRVCALPMDVERNDLLREASALFRRRAFRRTDEADWGKALYIYAATAIAWSEVEKRLTGGIDVRAARQASAAIHLLQDATQAALQLDGKEYDDLRELVFDQEKYERRLPSRVTGDSNQRGLLLKADALKGLATSLTALGGEDWLGANAD